MKKLAAFLFGLAIIAGASPAHAVQNVIVNGGFEQGNVGFTSQYQYSHGNTAPPQVYDVETNPSISYPGNSFSYGDHTSGTGNMMVLNGGTATGVVAWSESLSVAPNMPYHFSLWASTWSTQPQDAATLEIDLGGTQDFYTVTTTPAVWNQFATTVTFPGPSTSVSLKIYDTNLDFSGNDFCLDDISLTAAVPEPSTFALIVTGAVGLIVSCGDCALMAER